MTSDHALIKTFTEKAEAVSARVVSVASPMEAFAHAAGICDAKQACQRLVSGCEALLSEKADTLCETKQEKVMAAPNLSAAEFADLEKVCQEKSIRLIKENLHSHLAGIDIGFTWADYAIAETGTLVLHCTSEDLRLATMVSEIHMALVPVSRIKATSLDLTGQLTDWMRDPANYTAMITGASRTADIERVLALGVHGPLELHILLMEDN